MSSDRDLVRVLTEFARDLLTGYQVSEILYRLCDHAGELLPVSGAGVMIADRDEVLRFVAASDETVRAIESLQIEFEEGPCLEAFRTGEQIVVDDLEQTDAFPRFGIKASEAGMRGVFSFPMQAGRRRIGALNLYSNQPGEFAETDRATGQLLADVATAYVVNARALEEQTRLADQLQHALDSRVVIEQAKGRAAEQLGVGMDEAFRLIRAHARNNGRRLHAVAQEIVDGQLRVTAS